ncbi:hypothetical protein [Pedosphaera parvula]|uniref:Lipoprotein n=1 Tax=Pedosphaera parvula (strain Ellin514) TaxID=320771 RepID=B9XEB1_PEDPL|nr:hypothetical protein [Pedosphaera parvula]EEF62002.1 hypothetical protein Cflav_PD4665 [Pedosphaera parvula Ellin514]
MKKYISLIILASFAIVLAGCSKHSPTASAPRAIDLVQAGKDIQFSGGYVLHVAKREGNSLEGIHVLVTPSDGQTKEITADTGTIKSGVDIKSGVVDGNNFENQITITLHNAKILSGITNSTSALVEIVLHN